MTRTGFARGRRSVAIYSRLASSNKGSAARETRFPCRLCELAAPQKKFHRSAGTLSENSRSLMFSPDQAAALAGLAPLVPSASNFDGGKHKGSRGLGRVVSPPGMHARMHAAPIGDTGLDNDWVRTELDDRGAIDPAQGGSQDRHPIRFRHRSLASPHRKLLLQSQAIAQDRNTIRLTDESFAVRTDRRGTRPRPENPLCGHRMQRISTGPNKNRREVSRSRLQFAALAG